MVSLPSLWSKFSVRLLFLFSGNETTGKFFREKITRELGVKEVLVEFEEKLGAAKDAIPIIVCGDFNNDPASSLYRYPFKSLTNNHNNTHTHTHVHTPTHTPEHI